MVILRSHGKDGWQGIDQNASLPKGDQLNRRKPLSCSLSNSDVLVWLKGLALDPCIPTTSSGSVKKLSQTIRLRKLLSQSSTECHGVSSKTEFFHLSHCRGNMLGNQKNPLRYYDNIQTWKAD